MARKAKVGATKRTFRLSDDLMNRVEQIANEQNRTITAQIEVYLWDKVRQAEKARTEGQEPGNSEELDIAA